MTTATPHEGAEHDDLPELDATARDAAAALRTHVLQQLDAEAAVGFLPAPSGQAPRRHRLLAVAAAIAVLAVTVTTIDRRDDSTRVHVDTDESLGSIEPGHLTPLGPRDGKDSIRLPLTVEPVAGLVDGQEISVSAAGFQPGESVGIVQCAKEAAGQSPEVRAGVEACYISQYTSATADDDGVAAGTYKVRRLLTTPLSGTVDCAADADRCLIAMGALADYDRSGVQPIEFDLNVAPIALPTISATPTEGLVDGDVVHIVAEGLTPGEVVSASVCSTDPVACAQTAPEGASVRSSDEGVEMWADGGSGLEVDWSGRAEGDVPVWQFLPGNEAGTYVDCAVSRCSLRLSGSTAPPTVPLHFLPGTPPVAPAVAVEPATGLAPGDVVIIRGAGFEPDSPLFINACGGRGGTIDEYESCSSTSSDEVRADESGAFTIEFEIPVLTAGGYEMEEDCAGCDPVEIPLTELRCDGVESTCSIRVELQYGLSRPIFAPAPVPISFR
jgi:hypothetical protein